VLYLFDDVTQSNSGGMRSLNVHLSKREWAAGWGWVERPAAHRRQLIKLPAFLVYHESV
jgi:hypothetical protein